MKNLYGITAMFLCIHIFAQEKIDKKRSRLNVNFDTVIAYLSEKWQLRDLQSFIYPSIFTHYIAHSYSSLYDQQVIVKISESNDESNALQHLQSTGMVKSLSEN